MSFGQAGQAPKDGIFEVYVQTLGIDSETEPDLLPLAKEGFTAAVPSGEHVLFHVGQLHSSPDAFEYPPWIRLTHTLL